MEVLLILFEHLVSSTVCLCWDYSCKWSYLERSFCNLFIDFNEKKNYWSNLEMRRKTTRAKERSSTLIRFIGWIIKLYNFVTNIICYFLLSLFVIPLVYFYLKSTQHFTFKKAKYLNVKVFGLREQVFNFIYMEVHHF